MMKQKNMLPGMKKVTFRQWSRKSYAVFASLNKVIKIAFMANAVGLIIAPTVGFSQTDTLRLGDHVDVDEIVITGEREAVSVSQLARPLTIISAKSLNNCPQESLSDLLEYVPSIDLRQRGLLGTQADISIRGGSFDQNVILLNGINFTDPQTGHLNLSLPIESDDISRIEILSGAAGYAVGANSFSGAISFITPFDTINRIKANIMYGDYNLFKVGASATVNLKKWNNFIAFSTLGSDGYKLNTDFNTKNIYYRGLISLSNIKINYQTGYTDKSFGSNGFYSLRYPEQFEENQAWLSSVGVSTGNKINLSVNIYNRILNDHYILIKSNPAAYENYHQTNLYGMNGQIRFKTLIGKTILGMDLRNESIRSNRLGEITGKQVAVPGADSVFYNHFFDRQYLTAHLEQTYQYETVKITGGGIAHFNLDDHSSVGFYPGINLSLQATRYLKSFISINQSFRMPTFTDLFYAGRTNIGNRDLLPEKVTNYEYGLMFRHQLIDITASVYYKKGLDVIDWVRNKDSVTDVYIAQNISTLNTLGEEIQAIACFSELTSNPFVYVDRVGLGFNHIKVTKSSHDLESMYALDQLKFKWNAFLQLFFMKNGIANIQLVYQDREGYYDQINPVTNQNETKEFKPILTIDVKLAWKYKWFNPYIEATNITNTRYFDFSGLTLPGRWYKVGIKFDFPLN